MFIRVNSLAKDYHRPDGLHVRLYNGLSFDLEEGDFLAVTGASGWGKSTLASIVLGLESPTKGRIIYRDRDVTQIGFPHRFQGIRASSVFQRSMLLERVSIRRNLDIALSLAGISRPERGPRIDEALDFFGLHSHANSPATGLSAGQKRRVDLARALAAQPDFLVLDEPVTDLDTSTMNLILPLLRGMNRDHGTTILMTTATQRVAAAAKHQLHLTAPVRSEPKTTVAPIVTMEAAN